MPWANEIEREGGKATALHIDPCFLAVPLPVRAEVELHPFSSHFESGSIFLSPAQTPAFLPLPAALGCVLEARLWSD